MAPRAMQSLAVAAVAVVVGGPIGVLATAPGALKLDNYTLDKVLAIPEHSVLVKFDQSYAYGDKEDAFKELCKISYAVPKFLIGEVPVQEYGDKENDDLRERYKLKKDDFPYYMLFNEQNKEGKAYAGPIKADQIGNWLRRNQIRVPSIGTIDELDQIAKKFLSEGKSDAQLEEAKKLAEGSHSSDRKAAMYVKIMQKIKEKGEAYVDTETTRVAKIMEGKVTPEKAAEMGDKLKILGVFGEAIKKDEL